MPISDIMNMANNVSRSGVVILQETGNASMVSCSNDIYFHKHNAKYEVDRSKFQHTYGRR